MKSKAIPEVWVLADNPGAEALYAACGFERGAENEQGLRKLLKQPPPGRSPNPTAA